MLGLVIVYKRILMSVEPRAIVILIDNSRTSIDGDFSPNRLEAQIQTVDRYAQYIFSLNPLSQIAIGTIGGNELGIRASFTSTGPKISSVLQGITSGGSVHLDKGIRCAILALRHCSQDIHEKRILVFLNDNHDITKESAERIFQKLKDEKIVIDFVIIGNHVSDISNLKLMSSAKKSNGAVFLHVTHCPTILSDTVLASDIGPGKTMANINLNDIARNNPDLADALALSINSHAYSNTAGQDSSINMMLQGAPNPAPPKSRAKTPRVRKAPKRDTKKPK